MAAHSRGKCVSAVNRIGPAHLKGFGTIAGRRHDSNPRLIDVSLIIEKPDLTTARQSNPSASINWSTTNSSIGSACISLPRRSTTFSRK